ncbi:MAG: hypothetical protein FJX22_02960, partial [Alphaproteobacteria bacterium]|nr:hypothetical protein [Alphaproteobacteria bacterium]
MATPTATASRTQIQAEPYSTYVSAAWRKEHPDQYSATATTGYRSKPPTGLRTILNIMDAEIRGDQSWCIKADPKAPYRVRAAVNIWNGIGSTWNHAVDGACRFTNAAFGLVESMLGVSEADKQLVAAAAAFFGDATTFLISPFKGAGAVMFANLYAGSRIEFGPAAPQRAAKKIESTNEGSQGDGRDSSSYLSDATSIAVSPEANNPAVSGDMGEGGASGDYR